MMNQQEEQQQSAIGELGNERRRAQESDEGGDVDRQVEEDGQIEAQGQCLGSEEVGERKWGAGEHESPADDVRDADASPQVTSSIKEPHTAQQSSVLAPMVLAEQPKGSRTGDAAPRGRLGAHGVEQDPSVALTGPVKARSSSYQGVKRAVGPQKREKIVQGVHEGIMVKSNNSNIAEKRRDTWQMRQTRMRVGQAAGRSWRGKSLGPPRRARALEVKTASGGTPSRRRGGDRASARKVPRQNSNSDVWAWKSLIKESRGKQDGKVVQQGRPSSERPEKEASKEDVPAVAEAATKLTAKGRHALRLEQYPSSPAQLVDIPTTPRQPLRAQEQRQLQTAGDRRAAQEDIPLELLDNDLDLLDSPVNSKTRREENSHSDQFLLNEMTPRLADDPFNMLASGKMKKGGKDSREHGNQNSFVSDVESSQHVPQRWADYEELEVLGEGSYGKIYKVRERTGEKKVYVIKTLDTSKLRADYEAIGEINVMARMDSPYIVKYHDSFITQKKKVNIVMEYCEHGDLHKLLRKRRDLLDESKHKYLTENIVWKFFIQISIGLYHMHSQNILHRDLKTLNIFLTKENKIKIGDLGVAKIMENSENFATSKVGTPYYLSPEVCEDRPYNNKSDIWSLGCILYELCTLKHPFEAKTQAALLLKIIRGKYVSIPRCYSRHLAELIHSCLMKDFKKRPSIQNILLMDIVQSKAMLLKIKLPVKKQEDKMQQSIAKEHIQEITGKRDDPHNNSITKCKSQYLTRSLNRHSDLRTGSSEKQQQMLHLKQKKGSVAGNRAEQKVLTTPNNQKALVPQDRSIFQSAAQKQQLAVPGVGKSSRCSSNQSSTGSEPNSHGKQRQSGSDSMSPSIGAKNAMKSRARLLKEKTKIIRESNKAQRDLQNAEELQGGPGPELEISDQSRELKKKKYNQARGKITSQILANQHPNIVQEEKAASGVCGGLNANVLGSVGAGGVGSQQEDPTSTGAHLAPNQPARFQNNRLIQQSKYNKVLHKNKAIPEVGTSYQQMRKQYDPKLDDNQLRKLLIGKQFLTNQSVHVSTRFRHSRNRLLHKSAKYENQNESSSSAGDANPVRSMKKSSSTLLKAGASKDKVQQSSAAGTPDCRAASGVDINNSQDEINNHDGSIEKSQSNFKKRSSSIQVMPCLQNNFQEAQKRSRGVGSNTNSIDTRGNQKSTTDSEGKQQIQSAAQQATSTPKSGFPAKKSRPIRQPKIKPNYDTKAGGMMMRRVNSQREDVALSQPLHHNSGVISYNYNSKQPFNSAASSRRAGAPVQIASKLRGYITAGQPLRSGSAKKADKQHKINQAEVQEPSSTQLVSIKEQESSKSMQNSKSLSRTQKVSKNSKNSKSVERERQQEAVGDQALSKSMQNNYEGKESNQIYSIGAFMDSNLNHEYIKSTVDRDDRSNLPSKKRPRKHRSSINLITQADASSQIVLKDATSSPVCMEEDQFQLEEFDDESFEERLGPNLNLEDSAIKTPKEKNNASQLQNAAQELQPLPAEGLKLSADQADPAGRPDRTSNNNSKLRRTERSATGQPKECTAGFSEMPADQDQRRLINLSEQESDENKEPSLEGEHCLFDEENKLISLLDDFGDNQSLEDPFTFGAECIMRDIMQDHELVQNSLVQNNSFSKLSLATQGRLNADQSCNEDSTINFTGVQDDDDEEPKDPNTPRQQKLQIKQQASYPGEEHAEDEDEAGKSQISQVLIGDYSHKKNCSQNVSLVDISIASFEGEEKSQSNLSNSQMLHLNVAQPTASRMDSSIFEKSMRNINHSFNNISSLLLQRCNNLNQSQSLKEDLQLQINELESQARLSSEHCKQIICKGKPEIYDTTIEIVSKHLSANAPSRGDTTMADFEQLRCDIQNYLQSISAQVALGLPASPSDSPDGNQEQIEDKQPSPLATGSPDVGTSPRKAPSPINIQQLMFSLIQIFYINEEIKQIRELGFTTTAESPDRPKQRDSHPESEKDLVPTALGGENGDEE